MLLLTAFYDIRFEQYTYSVFYSSNLRKPIANTISAWFRSFDLGKKRHIGEGHVTLTSSGRRFLSLDAAVLSKEVLEIKLSLAK